MKAIIGFFFVCCSVLVFSQNNIRPEDILYKKNIVRSVYLSSPENKKWFESDESSIKSVLLNAMESGLLKGYNNQAGMQELSFAEVAEKLTLTEIDNESGTRVQSRIGADEIVLMEISEDFIFDRNRSEFSFQTNSITFFLTPSQSPRGLIDPLVTFLYEDCINVFKMNPQATVTPFDNEQKINFREVFLLKKFQNQIVKIGENSLYFDQKYNTPISAFLAGKEEEARLKELIYKIYNPE